MKNCSKCKIEKDLNNFSKSGKYYSSWCKSCKSVLEQERRIKLGIKTKIKPTVATHEKKQCLECKKIKKIHLFSNSKRGRLGKSSYCKKCHVSRFYDKEKSRITTQRWRDKNREHWRSLHRINQFNRKNKIRVKSDGTVTKKFMIELYSKNKCHWCKKLIEESQRTAEHIIPLSKGGKHSSSNLTMACVSCNSSEFNCK